jgi:hypothetical protein
MLLIADYLTLKRTSIPKEKNTMKQAALVYQAGIANVFEVESFNLADYGRDAKRLIQADFRTCESFARGLKAAGVDVITLHCNMTGDVADQKWSDSILDAPFNDKFHPVYSKGVYIPEEVKEYYHL